MGTQKNAATVTPSFPEPPVRVVSNRRVQTLPWSSENETAVVSPSTVPTLSIPQKAIAKSPTATICPGVADKVVPADFMVVLIMLDIGVKVIR